jgi:interleukin-1 receptor-associated kinase 4
LVYELLALGSLSNQLRDDGQAALLPWQTRVDILLQISTAINYLHCHNPGYSAYHRDIKADNIALSADYTAKLIDCGYAHQIHRPTYLNLTWLPFHWTFTASPST